MKFGHTIEESRKRYPELADELLENLQKWAKDRGLPKIPNEQLALFAHSCYFDLEVTKRCMNVYYTMRSTVPEFFNNRDCRREDLQYSLKILEFVALPKPDRNGNRIVFHRFADPRPSQFTLNDAIKLLFMSMEASLYTDGCMPGYVILFDMQNMRLGHLTRLSINSVRRFFEYLQEGIPIRLKAMHVLNATWFMDKILVLIKPFMKREFNELLHIHTGDVSNIYPHIPPECLPKDFGGELDFVTNLHRIHCAKLDQLRDYFQEEQDLFHNFGNNNIITSSVQENEKNSDGQSKR